MRSKEVMGLMLVVMSKLGMLIRKEEVVRME